MILILILYTNSIFKLEKHSIIMIIWKKCLIETNLKAKF